MVLKCMMMVERVSVVWMSLCSLVFGVEGARGWLWLCVWVWGRLWWRSCRRTASRVAFVPSVKESTVHARLQSLRSHVHVLVMAKPRLTGEERSEWQERAVLTAIELHRRGQAGSGERPL